MQIEDNTVSMLLKICLKTLINGSLRPRVNHIVIKLTAELDNQK